MAADSNDSIYKQSYLEVQRHMDEDNLDKCVELAKSNLTDPTIPPYYAILNSILLVSASADWEEAEPYRVAAEYKWLSAYRAAHNRADPVGVFILNELRDDLDALAEAKEDYDMDERDAEMGLHVQSPVTARDTVKSEPGAEFMAAEDTEDTAGLEDPFEEAPVDAVQIKGRDKAVEYAIPDVHEPVAAESQVGSPDDERDLPQTLRNLQRDDSKNGKKGSLGAHNNRIFTLQIRGNRKEEENNSRVLDEDSFTRRK